MPSDVYPRNRLFLHISTNFMEFFNASPPIAPKREVLDSLKEKRKKKTEEGGGHVRPSARRADILVKI